MGRKTSIDGLPAEVRRYLEQALSDANFTGYKALEQVLREKGFVISRSAIHRYGQKMERRFQAIRASTEAARMLTEGAPDDQDARSEGIIALVQSELFHCISDLMDAGDGEMSKPERIELLSSAAKNIATLARASVNQKRFRLDVQAEIEAAAREKLVEEQKAKLSDLGASGAVPMEVLQKVIKAAYDL
ncbi:MAG: DUF3486 family protein [Candidatus Accumulibacter sp.]|nr:DUF3486 family protein [Accumulibacter sp.]